MPVLERVGLPVGTCYHATLANGGVRPPGGCIMYQRSLWTFLFLAIGCPMGFADTFSVTLKTIDTDKKPIARADVDILWLVKDGAMTAVALKPIVTDADGKALLTADTWYWNQKRAVLVLSADRKRGGMVGVSPEDNGKELTKMLDPLGLTVEVRREVVFVTPSRK